MEESLSDKKISRARSLHYGRDDRLFFLKYLPMKSDYLGTYQPVFNNITVEWDNNFSSYNPFSFFLTIRNEHTLYHEIGHHSLRHKAGQDEVQENEANKFASSLIHKSHPAISNIVKIIKKILPKRN